MFEKIRKLFAKECLYISTNDSLLPPLSRDEEILYLKKYHKGDKQAKDKLIEHNLRLVVYLAKKYESTGYIMDDLISIGTIGLIKGVETYKINKNIKLATYASRCISNEILMFIRKNKKRKLEVSIDDALNYDSEGNTFHLEDCIGTPPEMVFDEYFKKDAQKYILKKINTLNDREKLIMTLRYGLNNQECYTQKEVAKMLSISQSYISRIEKKVIKDIKCEIL